jgi:hypothetical protein
MEQFTQKPVQFPAVKFEGGIDNATTIINWLAEDFRVEAYYKPERLHKSLSDETEDWTEPESIAMMLPSRLDGAPIVRHLRAGSWVMPNTPEGSRRFDVFDDESIEYFFNKVG